MARISIPKADALIDKAFPVLNKGFVRLVDYLGGDERIVQAARVSYGEGTKTYRKDRGLIRYLMRNQHSSPFEQVVLTFHTKMPIFVARQWVRHRTARLNEVSGRYSVLKEEFYLPDGDKIAAQADNNKQGRLDAAVDPEEQEEIRAALEKDQTESYESYSQLLERGIARELARINLPLSLYTEWYWQIDLHNLFHFLKLRLDSHAQYEIRAYAECIFDITKKISPIACEAFEDYILNGYGMSEAELRVIRELIDADSLNREQLTKRYGLTKREIERFIAVLKHEQDDEI